MIDLAEKPCPISLFVGSLRWLLRITIDLLSNCLVEDEIRVAGEISDNEYKFSLDVG